MTNPRYFSYDAIHMSWIYLYLACYLTRVGACLNLNLWDCNSLTSWAISTSPSLYSMVVKDKEAWNILWQILYIKFLLVWNFMIVILDTQVLFLAKLTHVGRQTQIPKSCSQLLMSYINLEQPTQVQLHEQDQTTTQGMLFHLREALLQVMSQSNSTRCE